MKEKKTFKQRMKFIFRWWVILIIVVLVVGRIVLPYVVLRYTNNSLAKMNGYTGHVDDIDIRLIRGAYIIKNMEIFETDNELKGRDTTPFFGATTIDLSVEWKSLLKGKLVAEVILNDPIINFKIKKSDHTTVAGDTADFGTLIRELIPITVNTVLINHGEVHFIDRYSSPQLNIAMNSIQATISNLTNVIQKDSILPSTIIGTGDIYKGRFKVNIKFDPLNSTPTFDLNSELTKLDLVSVNDMLQAYGNFDVSSGVFNVYTEFAAQDGKYSGYVKPLISDLDVVTWNQEEGNLAQKLWESVVAGVATVLTNQKKDQFATKVNISGDFATMDIQTLTAIKYIIINAYIEALKPNLENSIDLAHVAEDDGKKHILKDIFEKKDPKKEKNN